MAPHVFTEEADPLLSHRDAAAYLGFRHQQTLHNLRSKGIGPRPTKISGSPGTLYRMSDLLVWDLDRYLARVAKAKANVAKAIAS
ncbi:hypothetical protein [Mesorhizobium sp. WSM4887]|uniref:helix-turn-helix transcriptional regulator n=1 Tax=Mesorhizobium sp. WSM4887 TaxID=3038543 RepID=UPI0024167BCA|nr:hypothetical protein [Mesorhizobium sp. WSM4887]MDG4890912.1 hypothetical protein [Mesorhizobium sp. WSM4887]